MTRKISKYARKRRMGIVSPIYDGAAWANAIQNCRPYSDEIVVPLPMARATQGTADQAQIFVRESFYSIRDGKADGSDSLERDRLAHAIGVTKLRAIEIAGDKPESNPMLAVIHAAELAVIRMDERWHRLGRWGFDGPALEAMKEMVELYETVLQASSPAQMSAAAATRMAIINAQEATA